MNFYKLFLGALFCFVASWSFRVDALFFGNSFIHLADLFLLLAGVFFGLDLFFHSRRRVFALGDFCLFLFFVLFALGVFVSDFSGYVWLLSLSFYLLVKLSGVKLKFLIMAFLFGALINALLAIGQFFNQGSLGLHFLGESLLGADVLEVAKIDVSGGKVIRSYGFFSHANILAGYLFVALVLCFDLWRRSKKKLLKWRFEALFVVLFFAFLLTFSRSAILASLPLVAFYFKRVLVLGVRRWLFSLVFVFAFLYFGGLIDLLWIRFTTEGGGAISDRLILLSASFLMFLDNLGGVGFGNFKEFLGGYLPVALAPWDYQPVHNIYMLALAEGGIFGGLMLGALHLRALILGLRKNFPYFLLGVGVVLLGLFDHYLFSSYSGALLFTFYLLLADYDFH